MSSSEAREAFRLRLRLALDRAGWKAMGATALAREFNLRCHGPPVTVHATRKWLLGEAIPAQDKLQELAAWLGVSAQWLRFGESEAPSPTPPPTTGEPPSAYQAERVNRLVSDWARLSGEEQGAIEKLVDLLLRTRDNPDR